MRRTEFMRMICLVMILALMACSTPPAHVSNPEILSHIVVQDFKNAEAVPLFDFLLDKKRYSEVPYDAQKLSRDHQEIYRMIAFGVTLKTQVAVRQRDGVITAILDEKSGRQLSGFLQLHLQTKKLVFNFGPDYGGFVGKLTDAQFARVIKKLKEIQTHYSLAPGAPFQFYYNTTARFRMKGSWTFVVEAGDLKTFVNNSNQKLSYQRENQKHRCATDLFWIIFEMIAEGRAPSEVITL